MKKVLPILFLIIGAIVAIGVWRVATGRGLWNQQNEPVAKEEAKQQAKQTEIKQPEIKQTETKPAARADSNLPQIPPEALKAAETDPNIVALISDYVITKDELEKELTKELRPYDYGGYATKNEPANAKDVLARMVADKAIMIEERRNGLLQTDMIYNTVKRFRDHQLVNLLMKDQMAGLITVSDEEIQAKMKADPKLDREKAEQAAKRAKANAMMSQYYADLYKKSNVKKATANFPKASEIHQRLLLRPIVERNVNFIRNSQIKDELAQVEKDILMATFIGGKITLKDWFMTIGEIAPPYRPRDLNTNQGVDKLLERTLRTPILVAEAIRLGLDKNEAFRKQVRDYEDKNLLGSGKQNKGKEAKEPNADQIKEYFDGHKEEFREGVKLKIDQIWCLNQKIARTVKSELDQGKDFASVKQQHSLAKESKVIDIFPNVEAYFFPDLWKGDPNNVIGPVRGTHNNEFKWRIVKILEKHPGTIPQFSEKLADQVKRAIQAKQRQTLLDNYNAQLLKKYTHKIYPERIKDINPLDIP